MGIFFSIFSSSESSLEPSVKTSSPEPPLQPPPQPSFEPVPEPPPQPSFEPAPEPPPQLPPEPPPQPPPLPPTEPPPQPPSEPPPQPPSEPPLEVSESASEEPKDWRIDSQKSLLGFNTPVLRTVCGEFSVMGISWENNLGLFDDNELKMIDINEERILVEDKKNNKNLVLKRKNACSDYGIGGSKITIHGDVDFQFQELVRKINEKSAENFRKYYFDQPQVLSFFSGGGNYKNIIDPISQKSHSIKSKIGKKILRKFIEYYETR